MAFRRLCSALALLVTFGWPIAAGASRPVTPGVPPVSILFLSATAPSPSLAPGETAQLVVLGRFSDGTQRDVTAEANTHYVAATEGLVTIGAAGLVQGVARGVAAIKITYEQGEDRVLETTLSLLVHAPGDRDGDGLPDDAEILHGLNPDFAGDAAADLDQDGLSNAREIALGTDLRKVDTDGDLAPDGLEVALGTDPLVPQGTPGGGPSPPLNATCTVSALNRSARVRGDGSWVLPNVPANASRIRVRATCVDGATTRAGQSAFFVVPVNGVIRAQEIRFDAPAPVPTTLALSAPTTSLTTPGVTAQLTAVASLPDASTQDVTAAGTGTGYTSSNPQIATVSADGLVTARVSGIALISALHDGALAVLRFQVVLSGDSDGDGLPDDFELANGLDPNNPLDVLDDQDGDGLITVDEFQRGLDPFNPDTDGDRLRDGEEVDRFRTNPLLRDTDGDEVSDGLEVFAGSDPLDPESINLGPILTSLTAEPGALNLVFNTVVGEASQRLTVKGLLIDGSTIDLRRQSRGSSYSSSDLAVASFGTEDGRVFAGQNGTATVTVSNSGKSAPVQVAVSSFSPTALSFLRIPGFANGVDVTGNYVFVAAGQAGLQVVDASDLRNPRIVGSFDTPGNANDVKVRAGVAYIADGISGLVILDVSDPTHPTLAGRADTPGNATDLAVAGDLVYVADGGAGLQVIDAGNRFAPVRLGGLDTPGNARGVDVRGNLAVVADGSAGVHTIDVSDPAHPVRLGTVQTRAWYSAAASVAIRGRFAYVPDADGFTLGGLRVLDLSDPATPVVAGSSSNSFSLNGVALDANLALTSDVYFVNSAPIFEISGVQPAFTAAVDFSRSPSFRDDNGNDLAVQDGVVYLVGARGQISDNGVVGDTGLHVGRYRTPVEIEDAPPEVTLLSPVAGATVRDRGTLVLQAAATDDREVDSVQFSVDGVPVHEDFKAPYTTTFRVPAGVASLTVSAAAKDLAGNRSSVASAVVTVIPDNKPKVEFLAPLAGRRFVEASRIELAVGASDDVQLSTVEILIDGVSQRVFTRPPYRVLYDIPLGATQVDAIAIATDSAGQTATAALSLGVDDDPPPLVSILAPSSAETLTEGSRLNVEVGATDDVGIETLVLALNGGPPLEDFTAPYEYSIVVPSGSPTLRLTAVATDSLGQSSSAELVLAVVPDPLTTAAGRVVDTQGFGLPGVTVRCLGRTTTSGADGVFSLPGLPTLPGRVACTATGSDPSGAAVSGGSAVVPPTAGGITEVGEIRVVGQLLYFGSGNGPSASEGRLYILDAASERLIPWSLPFAPAGLSGLAFDGEGRLYAATEPSFGGGVGDLTTTKTRPRRRPAKVGAPPPPPGASNLLHLDPDTGAVLKSFGPFVSIDFETEVGLQDLTFNPADGQLYALQSGFSGGVGLAAGTKATSAGTLYRLNLETLEATTITRDLPFEATGLAAGPDGILYTLTPGSEGNELIGVDPATGTVVSQQFINGSIGASFGNEVGGMVARPGTGSFLLTSPSDGAELYELDPVSAQITDFSSPSGALDGQALGLAFRSLTAATPITTTIAGAVEDADGNPIEGADVVALGGSTLTGADGRFALPDVVVRTGAVRAAVTSGEDFALSPSVPPVAGVTELGTIVLGAPACVVGTLEQFGCLFQPVTEVFDLFLQDDLGGETPAGQITPDGDGRFCVLLRRRRQYVLRRQDLACTCGGTSTCEGFIALTSPGANGACGDPDAQCEDLGGVFLSCDLFCGS